MRLGKFILLIMVFHNTISFTNVHGNLNFVTTQKVVPGKHFPKVTHIVNSYTDLLSTFAFVIHFISKDALHLLNLQSKLISKNFQAYFLFVFAAP